MKFTKNNKNTNDGENKISLIDKLKNKCHFDKNDKMTFIGAIVMLIIICAICAICTNIVGDIEHDDFVTTETTTTMETTTTVETTTGATTGTTTDTTTETTTTSTTETTTTETTTTTTETTTTEEVVVYTEPVVVEDTYVEEVYVEEPTEPYVEELYEEPTEAYIEELYEVEEDNSSNMTYLGNLRITGYTATGNPTASGEYPYVGGVAMSRDFGLPWGTQIYIEGLGYYTLNDCGCRYGVVDVFCNSVDACYDLTSYADVYVVN